MLYEISFFSLIAIVNYFFRPICYLMFSWENMSILFSAQSINSNYYLYLPHITKTLIKTFFLKFYTGWVKKKGNKLSHSKQKSWNCLQLLLFWNLHTPKEYKWSQKSREKTQNMMLGKLVGWPPTGKILNAGKERRDLLVL